MIQPRTASIALVFAALSLAQPNFVANYLEEKVPPYSLPDPLAGVKSAADWPARRAEILRQMEVEMFGRAPVPPRKYPAEMTSIDKAALGGKAIRKEVTISFSPERKLHLLLYVPAATPGPVPAFLGLNFGGNQTIHSDPGITVSREWVRPNSNTARGSAHSRWQVEEIISRGYAVATAYYGDIDPDFDDGFRNGVQPLFYKPGQTRPAPDEWGSIAAWAWGLSRALDYLETDPAIDATRVAVHGHSRLGKTALWAGAADTRFAMVISNDSGAGGAALNKRIFGETVGRLNASFPHWYAANFLKYSENEAAMPFDSHMLIALIAPRPVYVASAQDDLWADPHGEFLGARYASPVYRLLGKEGLPAQDQPAVHQPVMGTLGYHVRAGGHDVTLYDWQRFLDFADKHFRRP